MGPLRQTRQDWPSRFVPQFSRWRPDDRSDRCRAEKHHYSGGGRRTLASVSLQFLNSLCC